MFMAIMVSFQTGVFITVVYASAVRIFALNIVLKGSSFSKIIDADFLYNMRSRRGSEKKGVEGRDVVGRSFPFNILQD